MLTKSFTRLTRAALILASLLAVAVPADAGQRFVRFGESGQEKPGLLDDQDRIRDLSARLDDISPETIGSLNDLEGLEPTSLPLVSGSPRLGAPISYAGKIVAIGFNYRDHAEETGTPIPSEPVLFMKASSALSGPFDPVITPRGSTELDYEVELVIVIGRTARYVSEADALDHVAGFAVGHDVSERAFQRKRGGQFVKGKSADTFAPLGPWLVTPDATDDVQSLAISSAVNGQARQSSNTRHMIFGAATIVSYVSQFMTLNPGDLIYTGTPSGVGSARDPAVFLKPGDVVSLSIEKLGTQQQTIAPPP
jgi:2-keto-4-pentenoate hydratase/2-oxohepta-3-ene-1,7-dioic acid hydratase in catechol pathway